MDEVVACKQLRLELLLGQDVNIQLARQILRFDLPSY
jgi:hypothetical protein